MKRRDGFESVSSLLQSDVGKSPSHTISFMNMDFQAGGTARGKVDYWKSREPEAMDFVAFD